MNQVNAGQSRRLAKALRGGETDVEKSLLCVAFCRPALRGLAWKAARVPGILLAPLPADPQHGLVPATSKSISQHADYALGPTGVVGGVQKGD